VLAWGVGWTVGAFVGGVLGQLIGVQYALATMASITTLAVVVAWTSPLARRPKEIPGSSDAPEGDFG
jgi:predicted MFS family arabinose efflux permease